MQEPIRAHKPTLLSSSAFDFISVSPEQEAEYLLALDKFFGFSSFIKFQKEITHIVSSGEDVLAIMPTSYGQSLCYQLPAVMDKEGVTLVVSPLIALMRNQVKILSDLSIPVDTVDSSTSEQDTEDIYESARSGFTKLLYVAPERLHCKAFLEGMESVKISRLVVEEAHCISRWGHDFRPSYLRIAEFCEKHDIKQLVAFTATAPAEVESDILNNLKLKNAKVIRGGIDRPNLSFDRKQFSTEYERYEYLLDRLNKLKENSGRAVVFCRRIETVNALSRRLRNAGFKVKLYHGGMQRELRDNNQAAFMNREVDLLVATSAFGMGVDVSSIHEVIHYDPPVNLVDYFQQAGNAGRDGLPARCTAMFTRGDLSRLKFIVSINSPSIEFLTEVFRRLLGRLKQKDALEPNPSIPRWGSLDFVNSLGFKGALDEGKFQVALGILQDYGVILIGPTKIEFLYPPKKFREDKKLPLIDRDCELRRERCKREYEKMVYYLISEDPCIELLHEHFVTNSLRCARDIVAERVETWMSTKIDPEILKSIVSILASKTLQHYRLTEELVEARSEDGNSQKFNSNDAHQEIAAAADTGFIRRIPFGQASLYALTRAGESFAKEHGIPLLFPDTVSKLRACSLNPSAMDHLKKILSDFCDEVIENSSTPSLLRCSLTAFLKRDFSLGSKKVKGAALLLSFFRGNKKRVNVHGAYQMFSILLPGQLKGSLGR